MARDVFFCFFFLAISIFSVFIALSENTNTGIAMALFFFTMAVVFAHNIFEKKRLNQIKSLDSIKAMDENYFYRCSDVLKLYSGIGFLILLFITILSYGEDKAFSFAMVSCLAAIIAGTIFVAAMTGYPGNRYICQRKNGIEIGNKKYYYLIEWNNFVSVELYQKHDNNCLGFMFTDISKVSQTIQAKEHYPENACALEQFRKKLLETFASNMKWSAYHLVILNMSYGLDVTRIYKTVLEKKMDLQSQKINRFFRE